jgi:hypothetical protein
MMFAPLASSQAQASQVLAYKLEDESSIVYNSIVYKVSTERMDNIQVKEGGHLECEPPHDTSILKILGYSGLCLVLVLFAGFASGLTIGFFSIGKNELDLLNLFNMIFRYFTTQYDGAKGKRNGRTQNGR